MLKGDFAEGRREAEAGSGGCGPFPDSHEPIRSVEVGEINGKSST